MNIFATLLGFIPRKTIVVVSTMLSLLLVLIATSQLAAATPYSDGYSHGCDDGKVGFHKYLNTAGKGIDFHTTEFMQGYDTGYKACFSPSGSARTSEIHSQSSSDSDTGGTLVSCNKSQHTVEYCNGYRAVDISKDMQVKIMPCFPLLIDRVCLINEL